MSVDHRNTLQALWGARPVTAEDVAIRFTKSLETLENLGGSLSGPWLRDYSIPVQPDLGTIRQLVDDSPVRDDDGSPHPESGYVPQVVSGDWNAPQAVATELGKLAVRARADSSLSSAILVAEGSLIARQTMSNAVALVAAFARIWQPDAVAFTDTPLMKSRSEALAGASRQRHLPWGYVAWLSDASSRHLDVVEGATTQRFGPGTLIQAHSWDAEAVSDIWTALLREKKLRPLDETQRELPVFPG